ncbi:hypothetical protein [Aeromonas jandaei]|uniref:hypothetical protein n=1 Tax=Aeromonas jandaei TaxID=650 RepID=UPI001ADDDF3D|nr:hypothetical protein [Aeromonas jandaei]
MAQSEVWLNKQPQQLEIISMLTISALMAENTSLWRLKRHAREARSRLMPLYPTQSCDSEGRETATRVKNTVKTAVTTNSFIFFSPQVVG